MNEHLQFLYQKRLERTKKALEAHNMAAVIAQSGAEVVPLLEQLIPEGATVTSGGSTTLKECGAAAHLCGGRYNYLDREAPGADRAGIQLAAFSADVYLASVNAITEAGEIYEMDGMGNRVAALVYGPAKVILVVGRNKLVEDLAAARRRNALVAAPANSRRLGCATPCATTGQCVSCVAPGRICCAELVLHHQAKPGRLTVILVNEELGF